MSISLCFVAERSCSGCTQVAEDTPITPSKSSQNADEPQTESQSQLESRFCFFGASEDLFGNPHACCGVRVKPDSSPCQI